jgi:hypothetical protein
MLKKCIRVLVASSFVTLGAAGIAAAQGNLTNRTVMTFAQPVEVPGKVLPAGSYTFELHETQSNRHLIEIFDEGGTKLITTVFAVPNYRLKQTEDTVIKFAEVPAGQPQAIRIWFYPGQLVGHELVYSKTRARELAALSNSAVAAVDDTAYAAPKPDASVDMVTIAPDKTEKPIVVEAPPPAPAPAPMPEPAPVVAPAPAVTPEPVTPREELPHTASTLPLVALVGFMALASGLIVLRSSRRSER